MQKPKESQIKKIVVTKEDKIATPIEVRVQEERENIWKNLWNDFLNIID